MYKTFFVPVKKEIAKINRDGNKRVVNISYKFIGSERFMASSLSNFVDNLAEEIHKIKCKYSDCFLEYESVEDNLIKYVCLCFNEDYLNKLNEKLKKKKFKITFKLCNNDIDKFILLLRKCFHPY